MSSLFLIDVFHQFVEIASFRYFYYEVYSQDSHAIELTEWIFRINFLSMGVGALSSILLFFTPPSFVVRPEFLRHLSSILFFVLLFLMDVHYAVILIYSVVHWGSYFFLKSAAKKVDSFLDNLELSNKKDQVSKEKVELDRTKEALESLLRAYEANKYNLEKLATLNAARIRGLGIIRNRCTRELGAVMEIFEAIEELDDENHVIEKATYLAEHLSGMSLIDSELLNRPLAGDNADEANQGEGEEVEEY